MSPHEVREEARTWGRWALGFGFGRTMIRLGARRGALSARLAIDPELHRDPVPGFEGLRRQGPLVVNGPMAAAVGHAACNEILRSEDFGVGGGHGELPVLLRRLLARISEPGVMGPLDPPSMLAVDPPEHSRYRQQVARAFTARKVGRMVDRVEEVAVRLLDELEGETGFDLVERYAALLPVVVISELLGVPEEHRERVLALGNLAATTLDPALTFRQYRAAEAAMRELHMMFAAHVEELRRDPGEDLLSQIITSDAPDPLSDTELHQVGLLVLGAGFETTVNLIGNAVVHLDRDPDQLAGLLADPDGWPNAVDETLRFDPPVQMTMRVAQRDTVVAGVALRAGMPTLVIIGGANRDPEVFADPHRFDVTRPNAAEHLAFSAGVHYCIGSSLARLEAATALRLLYERHPDLRVAGTPERRETRVLRGYERIPVAVRDGARAPASR
ncbi:MAG TPA: cytochrome P450 [Nocardioides sp.]|nr:cytochrome P450 [Nocardioides sp.]